MTLNRVMIIGNSGSGKSTAARLIGEKLGLPVYHMDREVYWLPNWVERPKGEQVKEVERIAAFPKWVFEGNNSKTFDIREARADLLIWLDLPLGLRLWRIIRRTIRQRGQSRPDMAEGCVEHLNKLPGFLYFVASTSRVTKRKQARFFEATRLDKHRFTRTSALNAFVSELS